MKPSTASDAGSSSSKRKMVAGLAGLAAVLFAAMSGVASRSFQQHEPEPLQLQLQLQLQRRELSAGMKRLLQSEDPPSEGESETETVPEADTDIASQQKQQEELVAKIAAKLEPVPLRFVDSRTIPLDDDDVAEDGGVETITIQKKFLEPHQFLHLHHMKTGGTSIDHLVRCAKTRLLKEAQYEVPYYSIHECSRTRWVECLTNTESVCRGKMKEAALMSYCSAIKYLDEFGWWKISDAKDAENPNAIYENNDVKAITVLRDPIERVWSMFRFQTKKCFLCRTLKEIYEQLDKGEDTGLDTLCLNQLQNHQVNNLLSTEWPLEVTDFVRLNGTDHMVDMGYGKDKQSADVVFESMIQEAVDNMKGFFTVIGITEELPETAKILGTVFPWMHEDGNPEDGVTSKCPLDHANKSPSNNRCGDMHGGEKSTHWDLPDHPDEETRALIAKYNQMDMELYEVAKTYFELQKQAMERRRMQLQLL